MLLQLQRYGEHMSNYNFAFGRALRHFRKMRDLSQEILAFDAGLDRTHISLLELGKRSPSLHTMGLLCRALDISLTDLVAAMENERQLEL